MQPLMRDNSCCVEANSPTLAASLCSPLTSAAKSAAATRVALILASRCGLRREEIAYLRACEFDRLMPGEELERADLRLRVRPWLLRKLKTSNAPRDLPLRMLVPTDELKELLAWVDGVRRKGGLSAEPVKSFTVRWSQSDDRGPKSTANRFAQTVSKVVVLLGFPGILAGHRR